MICTNCFETETEESVSLISLKYSGELHKDIYVLVDRCPKCDHLTYSQDQSNYIDRIRRALEKAINKGVLL
jgi:hypothetical protein